jgi:3-oxoacyl-[acyl-carrier-protein] synthase I
MSGTPTPDIHLAGRGLASALGGDLEQAITTLRRGDGRCGHFTVAPGFAWPYFSIDEPGADWNARAQRLVRQVVAECALPEGAHDGPLFVATSSLGMGGYEQAGGYTGDLQSFNDTVAGWIGWRGPVFTVSTACTSGLNALLDAAAWLRAGHAEDALVLGLELRNRTSVGGFGGLQLLSPTRALPLGRGRDGLVLGEAVAALHVSTRTARWRLAGGANVVDGRDPAGIVPEAVEAMCRQALAGSRLTPRDIDLIKVQAAGSPSSDALETLGLRRVFAPLPPLASLKATIGHTLGAAGVAELALLMACLDRGAWPAGRCEPDPEVGATLAEQPPQRVRHVLASILGFGGGHAGVVLEDQAA